jgi:putative FmdB family regulatory protein
MPVYEYRCMSCGERTEAQQHVGDPPLSKCPRCGGVLERVVSAPALRFKGSGWYVTDYARRAGSGATGKDETSATSKTEGTSATSEGTSAKPEGTSAEKGTKKENTTKAG